MDNVRQYVGKFTGIGRFSKTTVIPEPGMEEFLVDFSEDDSVIVFNENDFFEWQEMVFSYIDELQKQTRTQKIKGMIKTENMASV